MGFNFHNLGDRVRLTASFKVLDGDDAIDPDVVNVTVRAPDATLTTYTYGEDDATITRDEVGGYHADIDVEQSGTWYYRWWSTGTGQAGRETRFVVRPASAVEAD